MDWNRMIFSLMMAVSLLIGHWQPLEPETPIPQPDPFSDRYPAEIVTDNRYDYQFVMDHLYDVDTVQPLDPTQKLPTGVDEFVPLRVVAYINPAEATLLLAAGLNPTPIVNESRVAASLYGPGLVLPATWPTYETYVARWQALANAHPEIVLMNNIGSSVQGRSIWCLKITDNPNQQENEPEVKFSAAIHGDEVTGIELTTRLAELLVAGYGTDSRLTGLVDNLETWLCPIHNPDGYVNSSRYNAHGKDLNRNFPDPVSDPVDTVAGKEIENVAFMQLGYANRFRLGINYHGGELVVNYPWDSKPLSPPLYAPDDELFHNLSTGYASLNPEILHGGFTDGVTVGWEWYSITGGMQDWAYNWRDELHVTIEVSSVKKPAFTDMNAYWDDNREAMLVWMERALTGAAGLVTDMMTGAPLDAVIQTSANLKTLRTDPDVGDYQRLLLPGTYTLTATANCHVSAGAEVYVPVGGQILHDFHLQPTGISGKMSDSVSGTGLAGTVRVVETGQVVVSDPTMGTFSISLCPGQYTLQVVVDGYESIERQVNLTELLVEDFSLTGLNLQKIYLPVIVRAEN